MLSSEIDRYIIMKSTRKTRGSVFLAAGSRPGSLAASSSALLFPTSSGDILATPSDRMNGFTASGTGTPSCVSIANPNALKRSDSRRSPRRPLPRTRARLQGHRPASSGPLHSPSVRSGRRADPRRIEPSPRREYPSMGRPRAVSESTAAATAFRRLQVRRPAPSLRAAGFGQLEPIRSRRGSA